MQPQIALHILICTGTFKTKMRTEINSLTSEGN